MWVLLKDFLLVSMGMGIGVVLMCMHKIYQSFEKKRSRLQKIWKITY